MLGMSQRQVRLVPTLLLSRNVNPKIVSGMPGHAPIAITLDTFSHVLPNMQDSAAITLENALRERVVVKTPART
jgi:hypothetical protein